MTKQTPTSTETSSVDPQLGSGEPGPAAGDEAAPEGFRSHRIVVAEDEALIRMDLTEMLIEAGHDVVGQASDGEQAVQLSRERRPDIVVMDVKMPVMDGLTAAEIIGREGIAAVVMLTAFSDRTLVERASDAGVMSYVVKPFAAHDVLPALDIASARWQQRVALESEVADLSERLETRKSLDRAKGLLMKKMKLSEAEAFRWIQKAAMDRRMSMREVANAVVAGMDTR